MSSINESTVVVFDIRKFSEHRHHLGLKCGAHLLTDLVKDLIEKAVVIATQKQHQFRSNKTPALNHTGDGFVLIVRGRNNPLIGLSFISEFRDMVFLRLKTYEKKRIEHFSDVRLTKLGFGIGAHWGLIEEFEFADFDGQTRKGYLGSAINTASRVEQHTKNQKCNVICTKKLMQCALGCVQKRYHKQAKCFFTSLGVHPLPSFPTPRTLYGLNPGFHRDIFPCSINGQP